MPKKKGPSTGAEACVLLGGERYPHTPILAAAQHFALALIRHAKRWPDVQRVVLLRTRLPRIHAPFGAEVVYA